LKVVNL